MANRTIAVVHSFMKFEGNFTTKCFLPPSKRSSFSIFQSASHHSNSCLNGYRLPSMFYKFDNLNKAIECFDKMTHKRPLPSVVHFTELLHEVTRMEHFSCSLDFFNEMCALGIPVNQHTGSIVINCYCGLSQTKESFTVLGCYLKQGIVPDVRTYNTLLNGFILEDKTHEAELLFKNLIKNKVCEPNIDTYNTMIKGLCKIGNNFTSIALLRLMDGRGCKPDIVTYNTIIDSLCNDLMIGDAFKLFKEMILHDVLTYNSLIYALCKLGRWDEVSKMLKQMKDETISPEVKTCNIIVDALCKEGKIKEANVVIDIMIDNDKCPDVETYNSVIDGYCLLGEMSIAQKLFDSMRFRHVIPNIVTYNKLLDGYRKDLNMDEALDIYRGMIIEGETNMVTDYIMELGCIYRTILRYEAACKNIDEMQPKLKFPNKQQSYILFLQHHIKVYDDALALFHYMDGNELNSNIDVYNILIDGAIKCDKFDIARRLFHELFVKGLQPDFETYKIMISGLCQEGLLKDAKRLFLKMEKSDSPPDNVVVNELIKGYLKNKLYDDVELLLKEMNLRNYFINDSNFFWVFNQAIARPSHNSMLKLICELRGGSSKISGGTLAPAQLDPPLRELVPKDQNDVPKSHSEVSGISSKASKAYNPFLVSQKLTEILKTFV